VGAVLVDETGLDQSPQLPPGGKSIDLVESLAVAVGDLVVVPQIDQCQSLPVVQR
jgi:hypothetical protein